MNRRGCPDAPRGAGDAVGFTVEDVPMDHQLVARAQAGDGDAFSELAYGVADRLFSVAHRILRDLDAPEDATQQSLVAIWRELPRLKDPARFDAWAYRVLVRACYAEARREKRWSPGLRILAPEGSVDDTSHRLADRDELERAFRRLPVDQRAVLVLQYYLDRSTAEIAELLGVPVGTVKSRSHHAKRGMRAVLDSDARATSGRRLA
jgi:RNA polymerase sigma factor (sigma-70 family)